MAQTRSKKTTAAPAPKAKAAPKPCAEDKVRNPKTGRCIKAPEAKAPKAAAKAPKAAAKAKAAPKADKADKAPKTKGCKYGAKIGGRCPCKTGPQELVAPGEYTCRVPCGPDAKGRSRVISTVTGRCILAGGPAVRELGVCLPRQRVTAHGKVMTVEYVVNPNYTYVANPEGFVEGHAGARERRCLKAGGKAMKERAGKGPAACDPYTQVWKAYTAKVPAIPGPDGKGQGTKEVETGRCVAATGAAKKCEKGQMLVSGKNKKGDAIFKCAGQVAPEGWKMVAEGTLEVRPIIKPRARTLKEHPKFSVKAYSHPKNAYHKEAHVKGEMTAAAAKKSIASKAAYQAKKASPVEEEFVNASESMAAAKPKKPCTKDQVRNPKTGKCIKKDGALAKFLSLQGLVKL